MKILITGATGMIGQALVQHLAHDHELTLVGRTREKITKLFSDQYSILTWDELKSQSEDQLKRIDIIINLAGENIGEKRWSPDQKQKILNSRITATKTIAGLCAKLGEEAPIFFGEMGDELLLKGQRVKSEKLLEAGFHFQYTQIDNALQFLFKKNSKI